MYCIKCRKTIPDGARYCNYCGADQRASKSSGRSWLVTLAVVVVVYFAARFLGGVAGEKMAGGGEKTTAPVREPVSDSQSYEAPAGSSIQGMIPSGWAAENRYLADGGTCGIMVMDSAVRNCNAVDFTLSAEGNCGASTKGNWEVHFRVGGQWKKITSVYYGGDGEETFRVRFSAPTTFDAVSAFPTQRGNYSYSSLYYLSNAECS